ncbi:hypothetical protein M9458_041209, partial [Cirrhinus mrigala]
STSSTGLPLVPLIPPRECTPLAAPRPFVPPVLLGSSFPPAPPQPQSSVAPAPPWPYGYPPTPRSPKPPAPPWPSRSSASPWLVGSPSPPWAPPSPAPLPPSSSLRRLHHGPPSWLRPRSRLAPPATSPSCLLPGSSLLLSPLWLLPRSSPPWTFPSSTRASSGTDFLPTRCCPLSPSHIHSFVLLLSPSPSLPFFSTAQARIFWEGDKMSHL